MHSFTYLFGFMLATFYSPAIATDPGGLLPSIDNCLSSYQQNCSTASQFTHNGSRRQTPRTTQPTSDEHTLEIHTMLHSLSTTLQLPEPTQNPSQGPNQTITPPNIHPPSTQNPLLNLNDTLAHNHSNLSPTDVTNCRAQSHCLVCTDFNTTLTCYKFNCQCQRGNIRSHYMPASTYSCHSEKLCMTCPGRSMPFIWGQMAVCLNMWSHEPLEGEKSPLTGWSGRGLKSNPVGKVEMGDAIGLRVSRGFGGMVAVGLVLNICAMLA